MSAIDPWEVGSGDAIKPGKRARAMKRNVSYVGYVAGEHRWVVVGNAKLGDQYDEYRINWDGDRWRCECQSHGGGEYRRRGCGHILRARIWKDEGEGELDEEVDEVAEIEETDTRDEEERENEPYEDDEIEVDSSIPSAPSIINRIGDRELTPQLVSDLTGQYAPLPEKFDSYRSHQELPILECIEAFESGKKVVFLSAPTGSGKTVLGETVARFFGHRVYTCTTKSLQSQIMRDFPYAKLLMGRNNYPTLDDPEVTADLCTKNHSTATCWTCGKGGKGHCDFCHPANMCPYNVAKNQARAAGLAVLNSAYLLYEMATARSVFSGRQFFIMDEADALEEQLMSYVEVAIGPRVRKRLGIGLPELKGSEASWVEWVASEALPAAENYLGRLTSTLFSSMSVDPKQMREVNAAENLVDKLSWLLTPIDETGDPNLSNGWVMDVRDQSSRWKKKGNDNENVTIVFKPIKVDRFAREALWKHGQRWLLMSATLISPAQMAEDLGLERDEWTVVEVDSSFPVERRPVVSRGVAKVVGKQNDPKRREALDRVIEEVDKIMATHPDDRILVHTVSYDITRSLKESLSDRSRLYSYNNAQEREQSLANFLDDPRGVMLAPSFDRGIDLAGDDCRVVVIAKIPYPYLGDAQVHARLYRTGRSGRRWYAAQTIRTICQMTGRGMRSEDDWCISYILDAQFSKLYAENRAMFPTWWKEAVVWDENDPKWRGALADIYDRFGEEVPPPPAKFSDPLDEIEVF